MQDILIGAVCIVVGLLLIVNIIRENKKNTKELDSRSQLFLIKEWIGVLGFIIGGIIMMLK